MTRESSSVDKCLEHRPWKEMARKTGFGPTQISKIKKDMLGFDGSPKHTQAYAMFKRRKSNYEVAQELDLTEEQTTKYKKDYLKLVELDELQALYNLDGTQLQKIVKCRDVLVKKKELELEIEKLDKEIDNSKSNRAYYRLEVAKVRQVKLQLEESIEMKTVEKEQLDFMLSHLHNKYDSYKKLIENALIGDIAPLISEITSERREYDGDQLMNFLKRLAPAVVEAIRYDLLATSRVANSLTPLQNDVDLIMDRFLHESQFITDDWLAQKDKAGLNTFSFNI